MQKYSKHKRSKEVQEWNGFNTYLIVEIKTNGKECKLILIVEFTEPILEIVMALKEIKEKIKRKIRLKVFRNIKKNL